MNASKAGWSCAFAKMIYNNVQEMAHPYDVGGAKTNGGSLVIDLVARVKGRCMQGRNYHTEVTPSRCDDPLRALVLCAIEACVLASRGSAGTWVEAAG
jgi:hypothetical protein